LGTLNPATGVATFIGGTHAGMDALALLPVTGVPVPALSNGVLVLTALRLLGMVGWAILRVRATEG
jgi:hypothetical protein